MAVTPHVQWVELNGSGLSIGAGKLVADGDGYSIETSGAPDAFFTTDGDGISIEVSPATRRKIFISGAGAEVI